MPKERSSTVFMPLDVKRLVRRIVQENLFSSQSYCHYQFRIEIISAELAVLLSPRRLWTSQSFLNRKSFVVRESHAALTVRFSATLKAVMA